MPESEKKIKKTTAGYRGQAVGKAHCGVCTMFVGRAGMGTCTLVAGPISPGGWCRHFARTKNKSKSGRS